MRRESGMSHGSMKKADEKGMALVLILMIMTILTAMIIEFAYASYTSSIALSNWADAQRLSLVARSALLFTAKELADQQSRQSYTNLDKIEMPVGKILKDSTGKIFIKVDDENAKFNLNALVSSNGITNSMAYSTFKRLLKYLGLDEQIADQVTDWIDRDREPRFSDSEDGTKNDYMESLDELLLMKGIDEKTYEKLLPVVTIYGMDGINANLVNINTASVAVLMALDENITKELAERIISYRDLLPFKQVSDLVKVAGFEGPLGQSLMGKVTVKSTNYRMTSIAEDKGIKRIITCVIENRGNNATVRYWLEI
jgi:general secretion pathway protein K